ncbi:hypothetical protein HHK36_000800 [Tetracentron sinense]|uniref:Uncharacterized protein n=1 Tax=Tetracentron sinense TaxID=13715 RepID=A0A834ZRP0_TETSI|nr:hypothetical protein HHK36_000800 [Tetracentron sinense]
MSAAHFSKRLSFYISHFLLTEETENRIRHTRFSLYRAAAAAISFFHSQLLCIKLTAESILIWKLYWCIQISKMISFEMNDRKNPLLVWGDVNHWNEVHHAILHEAPELQGYNFFWHWLPLGPHRVAYHGHDLRGIWVYSTLQWLLADTRSVSTEDTHSWLGVPTTVCDIGKAIPSSGKFLCEIGPSSGPSNLWPSSWMGYEIHKYYGHPKLGPRSSLIGTEANGCQYEDTKPY